MGQLSLFVVLVLVAGAQALPPQKIVGGGDAEPGEVPYQVSLRRNGRHDCGGVIISNRHILTAAHCVANHRDSDNLTIVTGALSSRHGGESHNPSKIAIHGNFNADNLHNDIALISLAYPIEFNKLQNKVNPPSGPTPAGVTATVSGWGRVNVDIDAMSDRLQTLTTRTIEGQECKQQYWPDIQIYREQVCTYIGRDRSPCSGDSGGPLVHNGELIGLVSFGSTCHADKPAVFTSVYHYLDWIKTAKEQI